MGALPTIEWVVLTMGDRPVELAAAVMSVLADGQIDGGAPRVVVVGNGCEVPHLSGTLAVGLPTNLGVPGGRDAGIRETVSDVVGFLDDDAVADAGVGATIQRAFAADARLGAVSLRLVDESGVTARRHVPRFGMRGADRTGDVATFLGGACAIRRAAYDQAGGYFTELFYGHEEVELSWRLVDAGWRIRYLADARVVHPRTSIERHADGWRLTGRNRVMIARRSLPWPIAIFHVVAWLVLGTARAPGGSARRAYAAGWWAGWRVPVRRSPIRWITVWRLARLGRPPFL